MEYLVPALLVLILVGGFVMFMVLNATRKSGPVAETDGEGAPGIGGDDTPLGDTSEHAGTQTGDGTTLDDPEAARPRYDDPDAAAHLARPGEGEGHAALAFEGHPPESATAASRATGPSATERETQAAAQDAPDEGDRAAEREPRPADDAPASERLADRGV